MKNKLKVKIKTYEHDKISLLIFSNFIQKISIIRFVIKDF